MWTWLKQHPDEITLQRFQEGLLAGRPLRSVRAHLEQCRACQEVLDSYARLNRVLAEVPMVHTAPVPIDLADQILQSVLAQQNALAHPSALAPVPSRARLWSLTGSLGALVLAALLVLWPMLGSLESMTLELSQVLKNFILLLQYAGTLFRSLSLVLEPLRYPALVTAAATMAAFAWMASRRLNSEFSR